MQEPAGDSVRQIVQGDRTEMNRGVETRPAGELGGPLLKLTAIKRKRERLWPRPSVFTPIGDVQEHLTCQQGASAGVAPEHGGCHEMDVQGDFKQKAMGTRGAICPTVYVQMKTAVRGRESAMFFKSAELHRECPSGPSACWPRPGQVCTHTFNVQRTLKGRTIYFIHPYTSRESEGPTAAWL